MITSGTIGDSPLLPLVEPVLPVAAMPILTWMSPSEAVEPALAANAISVFGLPGSTFASPRPMPRDATANTQPDENAEEKSRQQKERRNIDEKQETVGFGKHHDRRREPFKPDSPRVQPVENGVNPIPMPGIKPMQDPWNAVREGVIVIGRVKNSPQRCHDREDQESERETATEAA